MPASAPQSPSFLLQDPAAFPNTPVGRRLADLGSWDGSAGGWVFTTQEQFDRARLVLDLWLDQTTFADRNTIYIRDVLAREPYNGTQRHLPNGSILWEFHSPREAANALAEVQTAALVPTRLVSAVAITEAMLPADVVEELRAKHLVGETLDHFGAQALVADARALLYERGVSPAHHINVSRLNLALEALPRDIVQRTIDLNMVDALALEDLTRDPLRTARALSTVTSLEQAREYKVDVGSLDAVLRQRNDIVYEKLSAKVDEAILLGTRLDVEQICDIAGEANIAIDAERLAQAPDQLLALKAMHQTLRRAHIPLPREQTQVGQTEMTRDVRVQTSGAYVDQRRERLDAERDDLNGGPSRHWLRENLLEVLQHENVPAGEEYAYTQAGAAADGHAIVPGDWVYGKLWVHNLSKERPERDQFVGIHITRIAHADGTARSIRGFVLLPKALLLDSHRDLLVGGEVTLAVRSHGITRIPGHVQRPTALTPIADPEHVTPRPPRATLLDYQQTLAVAKAQTWARYVATSARAESKQPGVTIASCNDVRERTVRDNGTLDYAEIVAIGSHYVATRHGYQVALHERANFSSEDVALGTRLSLDYTDGILATRPAGWESLAPKPERVRESEWAFEKLESADLDPAAIVQLSAERNAAHDRVVALQDLVTRSMRSMPAWSGDERLALHGNRAPMHYLQAGEIIEGEVLAADPAQRLAIVAHRRGNEPVISAVTLNGARRLDHVRIAVHDGKDGFVFTQEALVRRPDRVADVVEKAKRDVQKQSQLPVQVHTVGVTPDATRLTDKVVGEVLLVDRATQTLIIKQSASSLAVYDNLLIEQPLTTGDQVTISTYANRHIVTSHEPAKDRGLVEERAIRDDLAARNYINSVQTPSAPLLGGRG